MKKNIALVLAVLMTLTLLTACGSSAAPAATLAPAAETTETPDQAPALSGSVATDGSTSMEKVIGALGEAYEAKTGITVTYNPTGSGSGIKAVSEGRCDIGLSSRSLKDDCLSHICNRTPFHQHINPNSQSCSQKNHLITSIQIAIQISALYQ